MAGKFSQIEAQVQTQAQTLTPQQLLVSQLTEMPVEALYERVDQELKENIALERDTDHGDEGEEPSSTEQQDYAETSEATDYSDYADLSGLSDDVAPSHGADKDIPETVVGETLSFYDQLEEQIGFFHLDDHEQELIRYLIGSLDDDGLLHTSLQQIQDELEVYHNINTSMEELEQVLSILQQFDPPGIGARTLQECLMQPDAETLGPHPTRPPADGRRGKPPAA